MYSSDLQRILIFGSDKSRRGIQRKKFQYEVIHFVVQNRNSSFSPPCRCWLSHRYLYQSNLLAFGWWTTLPWWFKYSSDARCPQGGKEKLPQIPTITSCPLPKTPKFLTIHVIYVSWFGIPFNLHSWEKHSLSSFSLKRDHPKLYLVEYFLPQLSASTLSRYYHGVAT